MTTPSPATSVSRHSSFVIPRQRRGGFALLITITLLAFLVLLLVSLSSLTRVETQVAANSQSLVQARQNALMALNIAIGQLQKTTGPDQRVTAPADIILPTSVTITGPTYNYSTGNYTSPGTTGTQALASVNSYWADPANPRSRHWTGAWENSNTTTFDPNNPAAFNAQPALQDWLVSGNENSATGDTFKPTDPVAGLTLAVVTAPGAATNDQIKNAAGNPYRLLVGANTAGITTATDMDRAVVAPQVSITSTSVPGTNGTSTSVGHYAWWVGDEGIKARANLVDPYAAVVTGESAADATDRTLHRLQSAQRPAIEAMTTTGSDGLATAFPVNTPELLKVLSPDQLTYLNSTDTTFPTELKSRYYDLSVCSRGVLADVKHGGLKHDLSYILSRPTLVSFRTALNTPDYTVAPAPTQNLAIASAATPYAALPTSPTDLTVTPTMLSNSASWEQLWSFYNMKEPAPLGVFPAGSSIASGRAFSSNQEGLAPLLIQAKLFHSMQVSSGVVTLHITPVAVLANPYDTPLSGDFILILDTYTKSYVASGTLSDPHPDPADLVLSSTNPSNAKNTFMPVGSNLAHGGLGKIQLVIKAVNIPPGTAQIFTLDPAANLTIASANDAHTVAMINTYDPSVFLTYNTGLSIASGDAQVGFYAGGIDASLYIGDTTVQNRLCYVGTKSPPSTPGGPPVAFGFETYPIADGYERGGGAFFALQDGLANPQQATFYQLNYRALQVNYIGNSSYSDHPLQWGTSYGVTGLDGDSDPSPNPMLAANLLPTADGNIPTTTRWGLITSGDYPSLTTVPPEITDPNTGFVNLLYQVPSASLPISSLGRLEHFNLAGYYLPDGSGDGSVLTNAFQVNYPIANSYPAPRVPRDEVFYFSHPFGNHYDGSYLWNDILWDRFTFSSYPQTGAFDFTDPTTKLINARYRPFREGSQVSSSDPTQFRGTFLPAENLLVDGAFNINSTSVEAWKALFSSLKGIPTGTDTDPSAPFTRTLPPTGGSANAGNGVSANAWNGYRDLSQDDINSLAAEMVLQVRLRGPFLSLADFVNRRLIAGPTDTTGATPDPHLLGLSGALQSVLDKVVNLTTGIPAPYNTPSNLKAGTGTRDGTGAFKGLDFADLQYRLQTHIAGYPGYLLQGDVLSALAPTLTARSDTFTIRTYGDTTNPVTGAITGRAWCEAVVQRTPDYVVPQASGGNAPDETPVAGSANATYGRRYEIVSFRWLSPSDI